MKKLGIIGYGKMGQKHHEVFESLGAEVVASTNRRELGRQKAKAAGIATTYASYHEMLKKEVLDGVICSTSIFQNFEVAKNIIPYQIPLLLEKPPGTSPEELETLMELEAKFGTPIMVATNRVWYSVLHKAIDDIGGKEKIEGLHIQWSENPKHLREKKQFSPDQIHTRVFSNSIHGLSILHFLSDGLEKFSVSGSEQEGSFQRNMVLQGTSSDGKIAQFIASWSSILPWRLSFFGNNKIYDFAPLESCHCTNLATRESYEIEGENFDKTFKPGFYLQAKAFLEVLERTHIPAVASLKSSHQIFQYAEALTNCFSPKTALEI